MGGLGDDRMKIVIYTAIFGRYDRLRDEQFISEDYDYVCFTDMPYRSQVWDIRVCVPVPFDPVRSARIHKICPHRYLPEYEYSVWMDGNIVLRGPVEPIIETYLSGCNIAMYSHMGTYDKRDCIYEEADTVIQQQKDKKNVVMRQMQRYELEGYPRNNGLVASMIVFRRHCEPDIVKAMEQWWLEIKNHSKRDQLSFNYVAWKQNLRFSYIDGDARDNDCFGQMAWHDGFGARVARKLSFRGRRPRS